jgi:hypothetical protein
MKIGVPGTLRQSFSLSLLSFCPLSDDWLTSAEEVKFDPSVDTGPFPKMAAVRVKMPKTAAVAADPASTKACAQAHVAGMTMGAAPIPNILITIFERAIATVMILV